MDLPTDEEQNAVIHTLYEILQSHEDIEWDSSLEVTVIKGNVKEHASLGFIRTASASESGQPLAKVCSGCQWDHIFVNHD